MREKFIEQKKVLRISCYKEHKYQAPKNAPLDVQVRYRQRQKCDFGFEEITMLCQQCKWFDIKDIADAASGQPLITDKVIDKADILTKANEYKEEGQGVDFGELQKIVKEKGNHENPKGL